MFVAIHPMRKQSEFLLSLKRSDKEVGVPKALVCDSHPSQKARDVKGFLTSVGTTLTVCQDATCKLSRAVGGNV